MSIIRTDDQQIQRDCDQFQQIIDEFAAAAKNMTDRMDELNLTWKGPAKEAFMNQFQKDRLLIDDTDKELEAMKAAMIYARNEYRSCSADAVSAVAEIKI